MPIDFPPRRGAILICDFGPIRGVAPQPVKRGPLSVPPEIDKPGRRCIVVSPDGRNTRPSRGRPGLCIVVPLSSVPPATDDPTAVAFPLSLAYRTLTKNVWAKCSLVMHVSHDRLERPRIGGSFRSEYVSAVDMSRIETALRAAHGLP